MKRKKEIFLKVVGSSSTSVFKRILLCILEITELTHTTEMQTLHSYEMECRLLMGKVMWQQQLLSFSVTSKAQSHLFAVEFGTG